MHNYSPGESLLWLTRDLIVICWRIYPPPNDGMIGIKVVHPIMPPAKHAQEDYRRVPIEDVRRLTPKQMTLFD